MLMLVPPEIHLPAWLACTDSIAAKVASCDRPFDGPGTRLAVPLQVPIWYAALGAGNQSDLRDK
ncbi:hypothetical protein N7537_012324 [Penicillium hordei]|uniref:Uncharacterized protein n=1 Tax=Penicillium hordei TaxID=40994 RepID=A0AAD6DNJ3_9EURO|nr:uncharacterized protein N7537_012324 [Penicillium hordei]KAJ5589646.1 hypothetical protein N7537_012324 [Penicillium hordei]